MLYIIGGIPPGGFSAVMFIGVVTIIAINDSGNQIYKLRKMRENRGKYKLIGVFFLDKETVN